MLFINKLSNSIACLLYFINLQLVIPGRTWILLYLGRTMYKRLWVCLALYYVYKKFFFNLFLKWGGEQMGTLGKNGAWGDATCTCPRTCVPRPCSSLCMVTHVLALQVWLSTCSMVSGREESSMCRLHS